MSRFFDDLVASRRRGTAPGQAPPTSTSPTPVTTFVPLADTVPVLVCTRCGAVVPADREDQHADWHDRPHP